MVFFPEPRPAGQVRRLLRSWAVKLGFPKMEVFPKQSEKGAVGSGINLPFFGQRDLLEKFEPKIYDIPVESWSYDVPIVSGSGDNTTFSDSLLTLRDGVNLRDELEATGLVLASAQSGELNGVRGTFLPYHAVSSQPCLSAGHIHGGGNERNPRCSAFFVTEDGRRFCHTCFADGCRNLVGKTRKALAALGLLRVIEIEPDLDRYFERPSAEGFAADDPLRTKHLDSQEWGMFRTVEEALNVDN